MDDIAKYIFDYCQELLTDEENAAHKHLIVLQKIASVNHEGQKEMMQKKWLSHKIDVLKLIENGEEEFYKAAVERVLRENPNKEFLNLCPKCKTLTTTPKAKQCRKCFYSWHEIE